MMMRTFILFSTLACLMTASYGSVDEPLVFSGNYNYPPLLFEVDGQPTGLTVELARAIFDEAGLNAEIELKDWAEAQALAKEDRVDGLLQINKTQERLAYFNFSDPVLTSEFSIFTASDRISIYELKHLSGLRVASERNGFARSLIEKNSNIEAVIIEDWLAGFRMIQRGEIDAIITEKRVGEYVLSQNQVFDIRVSPIPVTLKNTYIAVPRGNDDLIEAINRGISAIEQNGRRQDILNRWQSSSVLYITE